MKGLDLAELPSATDPEKRAGTDTKGAISSKHPIMTGPMPDGEKRPVKDDHAFIYQQTESIKELCLMPWAVFKSKFGLYLTIALANGEIYCLCMHSLFKERGAPVSFTLFTKGMDRVHYYHQMPMDMVRLLNGT